MFRNKKGFELSINFIVMLIITLVVFGFSMGIAAKIIQKGTELKENLDKQTDDRLENLLTSGTEEVVIAFDKKDAKHGSSVVFGMGVLNTLGTNKTFKTYTTCGVAVDSNGEILNLCAEWGFLQEYEIGEIKNNAYDKFPIAFIVPTEAVRGATYVFNIEVTYDGNPYPLREPVNKVRIKIV